MSEAVVLSAGALSLELLPAFGGSVGAFRLARPGGPFDLMRPMTPPAGIVPHALYSGMFPMVPYANCLRDNSFSFEGRDYSVQPNMAGVRLNYHGSGWQLPWQVAKVDTRSAELVLIDAGVDAAYRFSAAQRFRLDGEGFSVETEVVNRGERTMPFSFGQHPWFPTHDGVEMRFSATGLWLEDASGHTERLVPVPPDFDYTISRAPPSAYRNNCYAGWGRQAEMFWPSADVKLVMTADPVFGHLMFHVPSSGEPVFCLEPQTNAPCAFDGLQEGRIQQGVYLLAPGEKIAGSLHFGIST